MLRKLLLLSVLVYWPSYSSSEESKSIIPYYGYTGNVVADQALQWSMGDVLPKGVPGINIQNVIYRYTIQKETGEWVTVFVQNERIDGNGYIFRERDDWLPGSVSGMEISKAVPVGDIPRELWGMGSIEVVGEGSVKGANVVYTYKVTPCYDPQYDPNCPGYKKPVPEIIVYDLDDIYDVTDDDNVELDDQAEVQEDPDDLEDADNKEAEMKEDKRSKMRLEDAMAAGETATYFAENQRISIMNDIAQAALNRSYLNVTIPGGTYNEVINIPDGKMPDANSGARVGLAQQLLHQQMVGMQYNLNNN